LGETPKGKVNRVVHKKKRGPGVLHVKNEREARKKRKRARKKNNGGGETG